MCILRGSVGACVVGGLVGGRVPFVGGCVVGGLVGGRVPFVGGCVVGALVGRWVAGFSSVGFVAKL